MDEIPSAKEQVPPPPKKLTPEEAQVKQCVEATKTICERIPSVTLTFKIPLQNDLCRKLVEKGFRVQYTLDWDSGETGVAGSTLCKVTISNPALEAKKNQNQYDATAKFLAQFMDRMADNTSDSSEKATYGLLSSFLNGSGSDIFTSGSI